MQYFAAFGGEEKVIEDLRQNRRERWLEGGFGRLEGGFGRTEAY
jgi:hypothetical protein